MRERVTVGQVERIAQDDREALPNRSELPPVVNAVLALALIAERLELLVALKKSTARSLAAKSLLVLALLCSCAAANAQELVIVVVEPAATVRPGWGQLITVSERHAEDAFFQAAFNQITTKGVNAAKVGQILGAVNRYVETEIEAGRSVTLSMGLFLDTMKAADDAGWTADETIRVLLGFQRELDGAQLRSILSYQGAIERIKAGVTPEEVLKGGRARTTRVTY